MKQGNKTHACKLSLSKIDAKRVKALTPTPKRVEELTSTLDSRSSIGLTGGQDVKTVTTKALGPTALTLNPEAWAGSRIHYYV